MRDMRAGLKAGGGAVAALRVGVAPGEGASAPLFEKPVELYGAEPGIFDSSTSSICSWSRNISA
jgi:hypothetical protein